MFTIFAMLLAGGVTLWSQRSYHKETTRLRAFESPDDFNAKRIRESIIFIRQDSMHHRWAFRCNLADAGHHR